MINLFLRVDCYAKFALHPSGCCIFVFLNAVIGIASVLNFIDFFFHCAANFLIGDIVVFSDTKIKKRALRKPKARARAPIRQRSRKDRKWVLGIRG